MALFAVLILSATLSLCGASTDPGLKIRFSRRGLDFVSNAALDVLAAGITNASIADQYVTSGKMKYDITGVRITSVDKPTAVTTVAPGQGVTWTLSGGAISLKGNWQFKYHQNWLIRFSAKGTFDVYAAGFNISLSIMLGMDNVGQPTIRATGCSSSVSTVRVYLHGNDAMFVNVFDKQLEDTMKTHIRTKLCEAARNAISDKGAKYMKHLKLQVTFADWLILDDRLVQAPVFTTSYVESLHKGEVFENGNYIEAPFQPMPFPDAPIDGDQMITIWITDYVLNTLAYVLQKYDLIHYELSNRALAKKGKPNMLDTTCTGKVCVGSFIPGLSKQFPNTSVSINLASIGETNQPRFTMLPGQMQVHLPGMAYFSVNKSNGTEVPLLKARVNLFVTMNVHLTGKLLKTKMSNLRVKMKFLHANFGVETERELEAFFTKIADICIKPKLDEIGDVGLVIPQFKGVDFVNPVLNIVKGALQIGVDFKYNDAVVSGEL